MKIGSSIQNVAERLKMIEESKQDILADPGALAMVAQIPDDGSAAIVENSRLECELFLNPSPFKVGRDSYHINPLAHRQISSHLDIPKAYYDRMLTTKPELLAKNVNGWMRDKTKKRLIRTVGNPDRNEFAGTIRAFLSDRYRPLDNYDLMGAIMPVLQQYDFEIKSCELTETHFYLKAIVPTLTTEISVGDTVALGVCIRNSDVGCSSLAIAPMVERLVCKNGMTINALGKRKYHVGRRFDALDDSSEFITAHISDEAREADDKAYWLGVRDTVAHCANEAILEDVASVYRDAKDVPIIGDTVEVVESIGRKVGLGLEETESVMENLIRSGELSQYGVANAVTRHSQDVEDYDRASKLESIGWNVMTLGKGSFSLN